MNDGASPPLQTRPRPPDTAPPGPGDSGADPGPGPRRPDRMRTRRLPDLRALLGMVAGSLALAVLGFVLTRRFFHGYLVWNLFLALVPLGLAMGMRGLAGRDRTGAAWALGVVWLLFLPNAPYLLTDFIHLRETPRGWVWGHWLLLVWFSFTGLLAGLFSVRIVHDLLEARWGRARALATVTLVNLLCGVGVALGRFERWNSWDILHQPHGILTDLLRHASNAPLGLENGIALGTGAFLAGAYLVVWTLQSDGRPLAPGTRSD